MERQGIEGDIWDSRPWGLLGSDVLMEKNIGCVFQYELSTYETHGEVSAFVLVAFVNGSMNGGEVARWAKGRWAEASVAEVWLAIPGNRAIAVGVVGR